MCYYYVRLIINVISFFLFFFKQKTAYEMRISDWSSDVCSSDLRRPIPGGWSRNWCCGCRSSTSTRSSTASTATSSRSVASSPRKNRSAAAWSTEERRVGKGSVSTCRSRWSQNPYKTKDTTLTTSHESTQSLFLTTHIITNQ